MCPPSPPSRDFEVMLGESLSHPIKNNKPSVLTSHHVGASLNKPRQAMLKKGGRKLRSTMLGLQRTHQQKPMRNNPMHLADNNVAVSKSPVQSAELTTNRTQATALTLHNIKQGTKKEVYNWVTLRARLFSFLFCACTFVCLFYLFILSEIVCLLCIH